MPSLQSINTLHWCFPLLTTRRAHCNTGGNLGIMYKWRCCVIDTSSKIIWDLSYLCCVRTNVCIIIFIFLIATYFKNKFGRNFKNLFVWQLSDCVCWTSSTHTAGSCLQQLSNSISLCVRQLWGDKSFPSLSHSRSTDVTVESSRPVSSFAPQPWHSCHKLIYVRPNPKTGVPVGHWPIPESFWPEQNSPTLVSWRWKPKRSVFT